MIEQYLVKHIDKLDFVIEQVLFLVPDSYFYTPEIKQDELLVIRQELDDLIKKMNFPAFRGDKSLISQHRRKLSNYNTTLKNLAIKKRQELQDELLGESDGMKVACLISLIKQFNLLSRLRTYC